MTHLLRRSLALIPVLSLLSVLAFTPAQAQAQTKPFKITGAGVGPTGLPLPGQDSRYHWAIGQATHMGRCRGEGFVQTISADFSQFPNSISGQFGSDGLFVFTGANGDQLACKYGDQGGGELGSYVLTVVGVSENMLPIVEALWLADFVVQPDESTGKFAGVTGSWVMVARSDPFELTATDPVGFSWEGDGSLSFPQKGKK